MTYDEVLALLKEEVTGVRKAIYGVEVREYIARSMEVVIEMVRLGIERMKELASDSKQCRCLGEKRRRVKEERGRIESIGQPVGSQCEPERGKCGCFRKERKRICRKRRSRKEERDECQKQRGLGKAIFGQGEKRHCRSQIGV